MGEIRTIRSAEGYVMIKQTKIVVLLYYTEKHYLVIFYMKR